MKYKRRKTGGQRSIVKAANPQFREEIQEIVARQPFARLLGIELTDLGVGWLETRLAIEERHLQQDGLVHGGVLATLADLSCALAAYTLLAPGQRIVTAEMKINFLRPVQNGVVRCRGEVLKPGRTLTISE